MGENFSTRHIDPEEALSCCCWCGKPIPEEVELFGLGGKAMPGVDLSDFEGSAIQIKVPTTGITFCAIVTLPDSDARKDGNDFMFVLCSSRCAYELKTLLNKEIYLDDILAGVHDIEE